jgi:superfamily II DNA or RNA helicase
MNLEIEDFLPIYPQIEKPINDLFDAYKDDNFNTAIYKKKEFYDEKLPAIESIDREEWHLLKQQTLIARFFSSNTPYDQLLLSHEMGTGKSCSAIGAIEQVKSEESTIKKTLVLAPGPGLLDNFVQEIILKCTPGYYKPPNYDQIRGDSEKMRKLRAIAKQNNYFFSTYGVFAKRLQSLKINVPLDHPNREEESNKKIKSLFSNMFIVMDEIHHLRPKDAKADQIATYNEIRNMCRAVVNTKILLMSGTPMVDGPEEIASIINLLLPKDIRMGAKFLSYYMKRDADHGSYHVKEDMTEKLKEKFRGRVSFLTAMQSSVKKKFIGKRYNKLKHFKVDLDVMSSFQSEIYRTTFTEGGDRSFELDSRQACLFVYPPAYKNGPGLFGSKGFDAHIEEDKKQKKKVKRTGEGKVINMVSYKLKDEFKKILQGKNQEETIKNIGIYSSKYEKIIREIIAAEDKCVFVYCEFVKGSGAILFSLILELVGFRKAIGGETTEAPRYALLTDTTTTKLEINQIKNTFNKKDNMFGKIIKIIIGSTVVTEGFSLNNVQEEHILTPHWNYTPISQALARGLRVGSHDRLIAAGINPVVKIYQHVSTTDTNEITIDLKMYEMAEVKDISIKSIDRLLKESSVDCGLTYDRNVSDSYQDYSRDCEYMKCEYKCDGIDEELLKNGVPNSELDYSTFQLYYSTKEISEIKKGLEFLFKFNFTLNLKDLKVYFQEFRDYEIISALRMIITRNIPLKNKYGFINYLKEEKDVYFLIDNLSDESTYLSSFYTRYPNINIGKTFIELVNEMYSKNIPKMIKMMKKGDKDTFLMFIERIPISVQEQFIEEGVISLTEKKRKNGEFYDNVLEHFSPFIHEVSSKKEGDSKVWISSYMYKSNQLLRCFENGEWNDCNEKLKEKFLKKDVKKKEELVSNDYGYYGIDYDDKVEGKDTKDLVKEFKIRDLIEEGEVAKTLKGGKTDNRKIYKGKVCFNGWPKGKLLPLIVKISLPYDKEYLANKKDKSEVIKEIKKRKPIFKLFNDYNIDDFEMEDLKRLHFWFSKNTTEICLAIKKWFKEKKLLEVQQKV